MNQPKHHVHHSDEYDYEPIPGLPALLPKGEKILWQGSPSWRGLARHGYHLTAIGVYFGLLVIWRIINAFNMGESLTQSVLGAMWLVTLGAVAVGVMSLLAWLSARSTLYTITTQRVVMRHGIALPMSLNIPFKVIENVAVKPYEDGTGEIALTLNREQRVGYLLTWPHVRPWHITRTQPSLRVLPAAKQVAQLLAQALQGLPLSNVPASAKTESAISGVVRDPVAA